jgi:hypothetical protein
MPLSMNGANISGYVVTQVTVPTLTRQFRADKGGGRNLPYSTDPEFQKPQTGEVKTSPT